MHSRADEVLGFVARRERHTKGTWHALTLRGPETVVYATP